MPRRRVLGWSLFVVCAALLGMFLPPAGFYVCFQRKVVALERAEGLGAVLWAETEPALAPASSSGDPGGWSSIIQGDLVLPLPPGSLKRIRLEGETLVLDYQEGRVTIDRFPPGFLQGLYLEELTRVGGAAPREAPDDLAVLEAAAGTTPGRFRLGMSGAERNTYAAQLLVKALLWDLPRHEEQNEGAVSLRTVRGEAPAFRGAMLVGRRGARMLVASPLGTFSFGLSGSVERWASEPARFARIARAGLSESARFSEEVRATLAPGHPLREWVERTGNR